MVRNNRTINNVRKGSEGVGEGFRKELLRVVKDNES